MKTILAMLIFSISALAFNDLKINPCNIYKYQARYEFKQGNKLKNMYWREVRQECMSTFRMEKVLIDFPKNIKIYLKDYPFYQAADITRESIPVSFQNTRDLSEFCKKHGLCVIYVENNDIFKKNEELLYFHLEAIEDMDDFLFKFKDKPIKEAIIDLTGKDPDSIYVSQDKVLLYQSNYHLMRAANPNRTGESQRVEAQLSELFLERSKNIEGSNSHIVDFYKKQPIKNNEVEAFRKRGLKHNVFKDTKSKKEIITVELRHELDLQFYCTVTGRCLEQALFNY